MNSFSEERLLSHFCQLKSRLQDPFEELVASYKLLAIENLKYRGSVQGEIEKNDKKWVKKIEDAIMENTTMFQTEKKKLEQEMRDEQEKATQFKELADQLVRTLHSENKDRTTQ